MKLKNVENFRYWLPVSKTWADVHVEFYATIVSVTIKRVGWALPSVLDVRVKNKDFRDDIMFYDNMLQQSDK